MANAPVRKSKQTAPVAKAAAKPPGKTAAKRAGKAKPKINPLLVPWKGRFAMPPFKAIKPDHYLPAFETALKTHEREIDRIARARTRETFTNTIAALENAGRQLGRISRVFYNLTGSDTGPELQAIEREMAPRMARHSTAIVLNPDLFKRVSQLFERRAKLKLDDEQLRVLERTYTSFVRSGARLCSPAR